MRKTIILISALLGVVLIASGAAAAGQSGLAAARHGTSSFHNVANAEAAGYGSTLGTIENPVLGCFENPGVGGMGVHYVNGSLMDGTVDASAPEALVYEMRANGKLKLVGLEYIVPQEVWDGQSLFGQELHKHPTLPLYVLHAWVWAPNPAGMFEDWNPRVGMCPEGVPIFGT
jgi:hypothetical protein